MVSKSKNFMPVFLATVSLLLACGVWVEDGSKSVLSEPVFLLLSEHFLSKPFTGAGFQTF
jgi:hypothetical protein